MNSVVNEENKIIEDFEQIFIKQEEKCVTIPIEVDVLNLEDDKEYLNSILRLNSNSESDLLFVEDDWKLSTNCSVVCKKLIVVEGKDAYLDTSDLDGCKRTSLASVTDINLCFLCQNCGDCFVDEVDFNIHLNIHDNNNNFKKRKICFDENYNKKITPFKCGICGRYLCSKYDLRKHIRRRHEGERNYGCPYCGKRFSDSTNCNSHLLIHTGERNFICTICNKKFKRAQHLKSHMFTHTGEKNYSCTFCEKKFTRSWSLTTHIRSHTLEKPFGCLVCFKRFTTRSDLKKHEVYHTKEKKFICKYCNKKFYQRHGLKAHLRIHTGETIECNYCLKKLANKQSLRKHVFKYHSGMKPFQCLKCYKYFSELILYKMHLNEHNRLKKYKCNLCGRGFDDKGSLLKHVKVHTRPFHCELCPKTFSRFSHLKNHLLKHLDD